MSDQFTTQLSAYLDGELTGPARARLDAHLSGCAECTALLADLRAIVAAAPHYPGRAPARDLWQGIADRLEEADVVPIARSRTRAVEPAGRRFGWTQLIAASLATAVVGGGAAWLALRPTAQQPALVAAAPAAFKTVAFADARYDAAVRDLEQVLAAGRGKLDTATVRTVEESLRKIDSAIAEARAAIQRDPANAYLSRQIAANMRKKLNLLRVAANAIAART